MGKTHYSKNLTFQINLRMSMTLIDKWKGSQLKEGVIEFSGTVAELLPNAMFVSS